MITVFYVLAVLAGLVIALLAAVFGWFLYRLSQTMPLSLPLVAVAVGVVLRVAKEWSLPSCVWGWQSSIRRRIEERQP